MKSRLGHLRRVGSWDGDDGLLLAVTVLVVVWEF